MSTKNNNTPEENLSPDGRPLDSFCPKCGLKVSKPTLPGRLTGYMFDLVKCKCVIETNEGATSGRLYNLNDNIEDATFAALGKDGDALNKIDINAAPEAERGSIIGGAYVIIKLIGRGGMGEVYQAEQSALKKICAIKLLPPSQITNVTWRRFEQEAKTVAKLDHINIVKVSDLGIHKGYLPFYAMEFVEGETLAERINRAGPFPATKAIEIFLQVLDAVDYAHRAGVIHRDIKPANIMLSKNSAGTLTIKILDFGLAKLTSHDRFKQSLTTTGEIFGSPFYMSPEQCKGEKTDNRSDIYSIGCALFECLTGTPPFTGAQAGSIILKHQSEAPPSLEEASEGGEFPESMEIVMAKILRKNPVERYQTCREVSDDLRRVLKGQSVQPFYMSRSTQGESTSNRASIGRAKQGERSQKVIIIAAVASAGLAAICAGGLWYANSITHQSTAVPLEKLEQKPVSADILEVQSLSKIAPKSATDTSYYSKAVEQNGHQILSFTFPTDIPMGTIYVNKEKQDIKKAVLVKMPAAIVWEPYKAVAEYPNYWKRFRAGELYGVSFTPAFTPELAMKCLAYVGDFKSLKMLKFSQKGLDVKMSPADQAQLATMSNLVDFHCDESTLSEQDIARLPFLQHLKALTLSEFINIDPILQAAGEKSQLTYLSIDGSGLTEKGLAAIAAMPDLEALNLTVPSLQNKDLSILSHSRSLAHINLIGGGFTFDDEWAKIIANFHSLKSMELGRLTPVQIKRLQALNIKGPKFDYYSH